MSNEYNEYRRIEQSRRKLASRTTKSTSLTLYQCPAGRSCMIQTIQIANVHSGNTSIRMYHVTPMETEGIGNALIYDLSLSSGTVSIDDSIKYLTAGDRIIVKGSSDDHLCVTLYGQES